MSQRFLTRVPKTLAMLGGLLIAGCATYGAGRALLDLGAGAEWAAIGSVLVFAFAMLLVDRAELLDGDFHRL